MTQYVTVQLESATAQSFNPKPNEAGIKFMNISLFGNRKPDEDPDGTKIELENSSMQLLRGG